MIITEVKHSFETRAWHRSLAITDWDRNDSHEKKNWKKKLAIFFTIREKKEPKFKKTSRETEPPSER